MSGWFPFSNVGFGWILPCGKSIIGSGQHFLAGGHEDHPTLAATIHGGDILAEARAWEGSRNPDFEPSEFDRAWIINLYVTSRLGWIRVTTTELAGEIDVNLDFSENLATQPALHETIRLIHDADKSDASVVVRQNDLPDAMTPAQARRRLMAMARAAAEAEAPDQCKAA